MEPSMLGYNLILNTLGCAAIPFVRSRSKGDPAFLRGRMGIYEPDRGTDPHRPDDPDRAGERNRAADPQQAKKPNPPDGRKPRIWFHAASVGEVTGAAPTVVAVRERLPEACLFLTVGTPQGFRFALSQLPSGVEVLPFPLDFPWSLGRAWRYIRPDLYVSFEGEFWPNLYRLLRENRVPAALLNGRLSDRSARRYGLFKSLFEPIFAQFERLAMHSEEDLRNVLTLGARADRAVVLGSSKYDGLAARVQPERVSYWRKVLNIPGKFHERFPEGSPERAAGAAPEIAPEPEDVPVVVGGSLRRSECVRLLDIFQAVRDVEPRAVGIFVPRHLHRIPEMAQRLESLGAGFHLLSRLEAGTERRTFPIVLVDRIGILFELYGLGDLVFCGGTLEPIGGHNILEPAAWEKPVFYGPHLQKVFYEHTILEEHGGSFPVESPEDLQRRWIHWIQRLPELRLHGSKAGEALRMLGGAAAKQTELIMNVLSNKEFRLSDDHAKT